MMKTNRQRSRWLKWPARAIALFAILLLGPIGVLAFGDIDMNAHWSTASRASSRQAPTPAADSEPLIQVYGARAFRWRGAFGIHTWIATKRRGADHYTIYQVLGWNVYRGRSSVTQHASGVPDSRWFNAYPELLVAHRGAGVDALIDRVEAAIARYPYPDRYRVWPGPNSNTFTAYVAREVPELGLDLPPTAIGKDFLSGGRVFDRMPSGTGWQVSVLGLLGVGVAIEEGIEINVLGLSAGIDFNDLGVRLPGIGRLTLR